GDRLRIQSVTDHHMQAVAARKRRRIAHEDRHLVPQSQRLLYELPPGSARSPKDDNSHLVILPRVVRVCLDDQVWPVAFDICRGYSSRSRTAGSTLTALRAGTAAAI